MRVLTGNSSLTATTLTADFTSQFEAGTVPALSVEYDDDTPVFYDDDTYVLYEP